MLREARSKNKKSFFGSLLFLVFLLAAAALVVFSYIRAYYEQYQVQEEIAYLQKQAKDLQIKKSALIEELQYVQSNAFVENVAKRELNLIKNGEKTAIMTVDSSTIERSDGQTKNTVLELSNNNNYLKWLKIFIKE